jgi:hypothetical protein
LTLATSTKTKITAKLSDTNPAAIAFHLHRIFGSAKTSLFQFSTD